MVDATIDRGSGAVARYAFRAVEPDGRVLRGELQAADNASAKAALAERGLFVLSLQRRSRRGATGTVRRRDLAAVFRSIASLAGAGVSMSKALAASRAVARGRLRRALDEVRGRVGEGVTLSDALHSQDLFPETVIGVVAAGERGSRLAEALDEVATQLESEADMVARVRAALAYPLLILTVGILSVVVMGTVIVPRFASLLADLGSELPVTTRILLDTSTAARRFWWLLAGSLGAGVWITAAWWRTPEGRLRLHRALLAVPVVGDIRLGLASARTCRALGGMTAAGMPLLQALMGAERAAGDAAVTERLTQVRNRLARGEPLARSLEREHALTGPALQLIAVGETGGELPLMTRRAGDLAFAEAERALRTAVAFLEPLLVLLLGGLVAVVAAGLLQAVYAVRPGF